MADLEKRAVVAEHDTGHHGSPDHLKDEIERTRDEADVIHVTTANPYFEINFIGTYVAIAFAVCAAFAGFIMPATALVEINAILGKATTSLTFQLR